MNARRRAFPGHTNSEIFYDGGWHAFDTDMAGLVFRRDGVVAGYDDIIKDPTLIDVDRSPLPRYPFAWPSDFNGMKQGWQQVAKGGNWYKMYQSGYAAMPGIVHLRKGETFTRYFDPDHFGGPSQRRFWHVQKNGPQRDWTYVNAGEPMHNGAKSNSRSNVSYCNGEFVYRPDLSSESCRDGMRGAMDSLEISEKSPHLRSKDQRPCWVNFEHFSPYVICGDPKDDTNPMTGTATGGLVVKGRAVGAVQMSVRTTDYDKIELGHVVGEFELDLTQHVKGKYHWFIMFKWQANSGIDQLEFTTVTQVAQPFYPRLQPGGCDATYRATSRAVATVPLELREGGKPDGQYHPLEVKRLRTPNVVYEGRTSDQRLAYRVQGNKSAAVAFRLDSHHPLLEVSAAARFALRSPAPEGCDFELEVSMDEAGSWQSLDRPVIPKDNEYSSGWMYGRADVSKSNSKSAIVRAHLYGGGYQTGLISAEMYGIYRTPPPQAAKITYAWKEAGELKQHTEAIPAGKAEHRFRVPTGEKIVDEFVRIEAN